MIRGPRESALRSYRKRSGTAGAGRRPRPAFAGVALDSDLALIAHRVDTNLPPAANAGGGTVARALVVPIDGGRHGDGGHKVRSASDPLLTQTGDLYRARPARPADQLLRPRTRHPAGLVDHDLDRGSGDAQAQPAWLRDAHRALAEQPLGPDPERIPCFLYTARFVARGGAACTVGIRERLALRQAESRLDALELATRWARGNPG